MVALLKHKLNEFCMHDGLENGRQQVGQEGYANGAHCNEGRIKLYKGGGDLEQSVETLDQFGCYNYVECTNVDMAMQTFIYIAWADRVCYTCHA